MSAPESRRAFLASQWRDAIATTAGVQTAHLLSPQTVEDSLLVVKADADAEATRRQTLRGALRNFFIVVLALDSTTLALELGDVLSLTHDRFGLAGGALLRIIGIQPDAQKGLITFTVWT